jgi:hypothetical protein
MKSKQICSLMQMKNRSQYIENKAENILLTLFNSTYFNWLLKEYKDFRESAYSPLQTTLMFIKQVLSSDKSCKNVVISVVASQLSKYGKALSSNTSSYVSARKRLPEKVVYEMVKMVGESESKKTPNQWKPYGRELKVFDGTMVKMPDTETNRESYPKHSNQKRDVGFPLARIVVVMSLITGCVIDYAMGPCKGKGTGEVSLLRMILDCIVPNDIVVGDRYFPQYFLMCDLMKKEVDGIFRAPGQRRYDFRKGVRLGKYDHIAKWKKPNKPDWLDQEQYKSYPDYLEIREFKVAGVVYVSTFLDAKKYHKQELATIYKRRWDVEINLNSIKTIMGMDALSCKTPEMVNKEIGIHFLAYNIIKNLIVEASIKHHTLPWKISYKGTVQIFNNFLPHFLYAEGGAESLLYKQMLGNIIKNKIGNRPGRIEPRAVKQKPKTFPTLKTTRKTEQQRILTQMSKKKAA